MTCYDLSVDTADVDQLQQALPQCDDLRRAPWRGSTNHLAGHCYVACEALYHRWGGREAGWTPQSIRHEGAPHWYLRHAEHGVVDPTAGQFRTAVPYSKGTGRGFLTRQPSKRARALMTRLGW